MARVRHPAVAGRFYPGDPAALATSVDELLAAALAVTPEIPRPKALIAPHAPYASSGPIAARAYATLVAARDAITRVVLLGPTHQVAIDGLALPGADAFATPLGEVPVPAIDAEILDRLPQLRQSPAAHVAEHSLEVHVPFLQRVLGDVELLPLAVGRAAPTVVAEVLESLWGGTETVIVVSSNLSHYHPYAVARRIDDATVRRILARGARIRHHQACGASPVNGLLVTASRRGLTPRLLGQCTSADTSGDRERVVGYASVAFSELDTTP